MNRSSPPDRFALLVLDVDGTLIGETDDVSPRLRRALSAAQARDIGICLCTGRPLRAIERYLRALDGRVPPVTFNGAWVPSTTPDGDPLVCAPLPEACVRSIVAHTAAHGDYVELHTAEAYFVPWLGPAGEYQRHKFGYDPIVGPLADVQSETILKAQFVVHSADEEARLRALARSLTERILLSWGVSPGYEGRFCNVMRAGVDKAASVDVVLGALGITWERVFAAGDSPNDLPYVQRAGYGLIMGNAPEAVRDAAPHVGGSVEEEGLAEAIERVVLA